MTIKHLFLTSFRSYPKRKFAFSPKTTLIIGDNATGKTNLMEAIFFLSMGKSFRADKDTDMIEFGSELSRVKGVIEKPSEQVNKQLSNQAIELEIVLTTGEVMGIKAPLKKYSINGVGKSMLDFGGTLKTVLFWPQDLELVTDSPGKRRRYLDFVLLQVDREYRRSLNSYERAIRQRNRVLEAIRDTGADRKQLMFWDQLIIKDGNYITKKREEYINYINGIQSRFDRDRIQNYSLIYDSSIISRARLDQYKEEEVAAGATLVGPHRDDFEFRTQNSELRTGDREEKKTPPRWPRRNVGDSADGGGTKKETRNLSQYGSRGEQRMAVLWLKLGELRFIEQTTSDKPILLLDDIFSELDHPHREIIFNIIGNQQTIMTTTDVHLIEKRVLEKTSLIELV